MIGVRNPMWHSAWNVLGLYRIRTFFGKLWEVIEIDNVIFQGVESFWGKRYFSKMAMEKIWIFDWENSKIS